MQFYSIWYGCWRRLMLYVVWNSRKTGRKSGCKLFAWRWDNFVLWQLCLSEQKPVCFCPQCLGITILSDWHHPKILREGSYPEWRRLHELPHWKKKEKGIAISHSFINLNSLYRKLSASYWVPAIHSSNVTISSDAILLL